MHVSCIYRQNSIYMSMHACMFSQDEHVHVMDVNLMTKICDGNFYYDRKRMITVSRAGRYCIFSARYIV